jgi:hypothetical protein
MKRLRILISLIPRAAARVLASSDVMTAVAKALFLRQPAHVQEAFKLLLRPFFMVGAAFCDAAPFVP